jgi:hypothetical protein
MLTIEANTAVPNQENFQVIHGGEYNECDLVEVYHKDDENKAPACSFQAFFILNGKHFGE